MCGRQVKPYRTCHYCESLRGAKVWLTSQHGACRGGQSRSRAVSQLSQAPLKPWYVHGQPGVPGVLLVSGPNLVHTLEAPGCRILPSKLIHRSHVCPVHLAQDWTPEVGGGSYLQQRWPKRDRRWLPWCGPHCLTHLAGPAGYSMPVHGNGLAEAAGPCDGRCPACAGGRQCLQTGLPSLLAVDVRSESLQSSQLAPFSSYPCPLQQLLPVGGLGSVPTSLRLGEAVYSEPWKVFHELQPQPLKPLRVCLFPSKVSSNKDRDEGNKEALGREEAHSAKW